MTKLPVISGQQCVKSLEKVGYSFSRQKGSHIILKREDPPSRLVVPDHRELDRGTLRAIIRQASLTVEEFVTLLD